MLNLFFILLIGERSCLVQNHDGGIFQNHTGDGNTLLFTARKPVSRIPGHRVIAIVQFLYKFITAGGFCGCIYFFVRSIGISQPDIFLDRAVEQEIILCNKTDNIGKLSQRHTANVHTANGDLSIADIPKTSNQASDGGLASTGRSDKSRKLSLRDFQIDMGKHLFTVLFVIRERNILKLNVFGLQIHWLPSIGQFFYMEQLVYIVYGINSYIAQVDFYSKHIAGKEEWEMVDIYADEGISGLEARNRDEFNRMMADCREGKIDRVLCKSISRFARNTQEYIQFVRELLRLGISIHFEKENIDTGKMTSEQIAQIYGAFAQMESTSHSSNMRFSVRMRMENGLFVPPSVPYGYRLAGRDLEIVPEEAEVVRRIFSAYLSGQGKDDIAKELNQLGVDRGRNREKWYPSTVAYILTNISYTGNMIWQKSYATDTIPFQQVRNRGQKPRYFVEHSHPAIVSSEDFQRVQKLMSFRNGQFRGTVRQRRETLYSKRIYCGECGSLCRKKVTGGKTYWVCRRHDSDKADCPIPQIPELEITAAVLRLYHKLKLGLETVLRPVLTQLQELRERELRSNRKISDIDNEIARISEQNLVLVRLKSKGYVDSALYLSQMDEIEHKLQELRKLRRRLLETAGEDRQIQETERMLEYLTDSPEWLDEVTSDLFRELIERITIISPTRLKFRLLNGLELSESIERMIR